MPKSAKKCQKLPKILENRRNRRKLLKRHRMLIINISQQYNKELKVTQSKFHTTSILPSYFGKTKTFLKRDRNWLRGAALPRCPESAKAKHYCKNEEKSVRIGNSRPPAQNEILHRILRSEIRTSWSKKETLFWGKKLWKWKETNQIKVLSKSLMLFQSLERTCIERRKTHFC